MPSSGGASEGSGRRQGRIVERQILKPRNIVRGVVETKVPNQPARPPRPT